MKIFSPYGKDVKTELQEVYNLTSEEALLDIVYPHLLQSYGFKTVKIEHINIAFGMAIKLIGDGQPYYLKFTGKANHEKPEQLFDLLNYLRVQGIPVAENIPMLQGNYFKNILSNSPYDVTYLMREVTGTVPNELTSERLKQFIEVMAQFHQVGFEYHPKVFASSRGLAYFLNETVSFFKEVNPFSETQNAYLERLVKTMENNFARVAWGNDLSKSHIHWDFRLCHVLFNGEGVSGIIDAEQTTFMERLFDVAIGIVSHSDPARALLLSNEQILEGLHLYNQLYPFSSADYKTLKTMLLCALYRELSGKILFLSTDASDTKPEDVEKLWQSIEYFYKMPDDLDL